MGLHLDVRSDGLGMDSCTALPIKCAYQTVLEQYLFRKRLAVYPTSKSVIFFAAFLPQFYDPQHSLLLQFLVCERLRPSPSTRR